MEQGHTIGQIRDRLFTAVLSDILDAVGRPGQVADIDLQAIGDGTPIVGWAQTARAVAVNQAPAEPYAQLLRAIDGTKPGTVLVLEMPPSSTSAIFGGLLATAVQVAGGEGVVVDGYVRDVREIRSIGLPTSARGFRPLDSFGRDEVVSVSEPVSIGGVLVRQGDLVFGDEDGLLFVPADIAKDVVERAFDKVQGESHVRSALKEGLTATEAFATYGVL